MSSAVIKARLGFEKEKAIEIGTAVALARDKFVKELNELNELETLCCGHRYNDSNAD